MEIKIISESCTRLMISLRCNEACQLACSHAASVQRNSPSFPLQNKQTKKTKTKQSQVHNSLPTYGHMFAQLCGLIMIHLPWSAAAKVVAVDRWAASKVKRLLMIHHQVLLLPLPSTTFHSPNSFLNFSVSAQRYTLTKINRCKVMEHIDWTK